MNTSSRVKRREKRGNVALIVMLSGSVLLGMGALAVDASLARTGRTEVQAAADAASQAAVFYLDKTATGLTNAKSAAVLYANKYTAGGNPIAITTADVTTGIWANGTFTASSVAASVNAVRVDVALGDIGGFFAGGAFGMNALAVKASATASAGATTMGPAEGAGSVDCFIPLAISDCLFTKYPGQSIETVSLVLNPDGQDTAGWTNPDGNVSAATTKAYIQSLSNGKCAGDGVTASVGGTTHLVNGVVASAMEAMADAIETSTQTWDTQTFGLMPTQLSNSSVASTAYGRVLGGAIITFTDAEYCSGDGGSFNKTKTISGFAKAYVYDVRSKGKSGEKTIEMIIDRTNALDSGTVGGGPNYGVTYTPAITTSTGVVQ